MSLSNMLEFGNEIFISFWDIRENVESYIFLVSPLENGLPVTKWRTNISFGIMLNFEIEIFVSF